MSHEQARLVLRLQAAESDLEAARLRASPHVLMRPAIFPDGNMWCSLYGESLQDGVAGFGETPELACADFDKNWREMRLHPAALAEKEQ